MLSFVLFKTTVILFTSIEGAALFVFGTCAPAAALRAVAETSGDLAGKTDIDSAVISTIAAISLFWQHQNMG